MDVADILGKIATGGWAAFDEGALRAAQASEEAAAREEMMAEARIVARALDNENGRAFLEWLMRKTLLRPATAAELDVRTVEERALKAERELGMKQLVMTIYAALATARGEDAEEAPPRGQRRSNRRTKNAQVG